MIASLYGTALRSHSAARDHRSMDEKSFKKHLKDLAHGHHHPEEHDWSGAGAATAPAKPTRGAKAKKASPAKARKRSTSHAKKRAK